MLELQEDVAVRAMQGIGDLFPGGGLFRVADAGGVDIALSHRTDLGGLGNDQAGACPLLIVLDRQIVGFQSGDGAIHLADRFMLLREALQRH